VLLLVGNDWKKKGLPCLLEAVGRLDNPNLWVLVRGRDDLAPYKNLVNQHRLAKRVLILPSRPEVEFYYAAADLYVGPSWKTRSHCRRSRPWPADCR
jgi:glycosyltransferase involved in cell wall biosynthesis